MNFFCDTYLTLHDLYFYHVFYVRIFLYLPVINFTPLTRVLVRDAIIDHVNLYLIKTN